MWAALLILSDKFYEKIEVSYYNAVDITIIKPMSEVSVDFLVKPKLRL